MSTDPIRADASETEAVLSLQEAAAVDDDVQAHDAMSATSVALCGPPTHPTLPTEA
ncbi:hypothetical protein [Kitasatospora sp. CB01950]|uniref:hypothetical protein n=1 Tax=Kitasatospora sp. CB01950 TaxID=1703930 RepID=UPI0013016C18|nr:hypothetical protein [Kitasatospora sp. CB01950]